VLVTITVYDGGEHRRQRPGGYTGDLRRHGACGSLIEVFIPRGHGIASSGVAVRGHEHPVDLTG
jgi:hypothetical protein